MQYEVGYTRDTDKVDAQYTVRATWAGERATSIGSMSLPVTAQRVVVSKLCPAGTVAPELTGATNIEDPRVTDLQFKYAPAAGVVTRVQYATRAASGPFFTLLETTATAGPLALDVRPLMNQRIWLRVVGIDQARGCYVASKPVIVQPLPAPTALPTLATGCPQGLMVRWTNTSLWGNDFDVQYRVDKGAWQPLPKELKFKATGVKNEWRVCHAPIPALSEYSYRVRRTYVSPTDKTLQSASRWSSETDPRVSGNGGLPLKNGDIEAPTPGLKPHDPLLGWSRGAWAHHVDYKRAGYLALGARFGYYATDTEAVAQTLPVELEAGRTYTFKGHVTGGGDNKGKVPFQIGYLAVDGDAKSFEALATKVYAVNATWIPVAGVSFVVPSGHTAIGKRHVVRLGGKADGGETDIWFDNLAVSVISK